MANDQHLEIIKRSIDAWNEWRDANPNIEANLEGANLGGADLRNANLRNATLAEADFGNANLRNANLGGADLRNADLSGANLSETDLAMAYLDRADLRNANLDRAYLLGTYLGNANLGEADLNMAIFYGANLEGANLGLAEIYGTILSDVDLSTTKGLNDCRHLGPSSLDHKTITLSKDVPIRFWRGCGLPDALIDYMPSLTGNAIQFYSCFISYSSKDQEFADRLHADLQNNGVRCWFAPHDLSIGAKTWDGIDEAIRTRDKVLLILSEGAIASGWVEDEVTTAFAEERRRDELVLFPVRLDDTVMDTNESWAGKLRDNRNIGDFSQWKDHDAYKATLDRVLRDLKASR